MVLPSASQQLGSFEHVLLCFWVGDLITAHEYICISQRLIFKEPSRCKLFDISAWLDFSRLQKSSIWGDAPNITPRWGTKGAVTVLQLYIYTSVHFCLCTFVYLCFCICTFIHLMWDKRPCWDDPLNITPRWAGRKLTTGQQSHRRSRPMFMFNPDPASNVQMCNAAMPHLVESVQILCHLCSRRHQLVRHEWSNERSNGPTSDQICN